MKTDRHSVQRAGASCRFSLPRNCSKLRSAGKPGDSETQCILKAMEVSTAIASGISEQRLFSEKAIAFATAVGGPLAGAFLLSRNFRALDMEVRARKTLYLGFGCMTLFVALLFAVPQRIVDSIPEAAFSAFWGSVAYAAVEKYQKGFIVEHIAAGGRKASGWLAAGISLIGLALTLLIILPFAWVQPPYDGNSITLEKSGCKVYYEEEITAEQARILGQLLETIEYFSPRDNRTAKLEEKGSRYNVVLEIDKTYWEEPGLADWFDALIRDLERFYGSEVQVTAVSLNLRGKNDEKVFLKLPREEGA